jgi:nucleotide-binding universal stress UspA family protein
MSDERSIMKILLAVDESAYAEEAVRDVEARLTVADTQVRVLHVVGTFIPPAATVVEADGSLESVRKGVADRYEELVNGIAEKFRQLGVTAEGVVREGNAGKTIVNEAKEWKADLIVIGAHGLTGLESLAMGNVARYVVDHAPCSVTAVKPKNKK